MNNYYNASHYVDKTCGQALNNISKKEKEIASRDRAKNFVGIILRMASMCGFHIIGITLQDNRTGKVFRR